MLGPAGHFGVDAFGFQLLADDRDHFVDILFPVGFFLGDVAFELVVNLRMEILERQVFKLAFDPGDAQAVRQRRVNIQGLLRRENLFVGRHMIERAHVVHPVGELDENHPHVLAHGENHLAKIFRLLLLMAAIVGAAQLGDAVDQRRRSRGRTNS